MRKINTKKAPAAIGPYCQGIVVENFIFTSGQLPIDPETGELAGGCIEEQAERALMNVQEVLYSVGSTLDDVIKTTCFLVDMSHFEKFNKVYSHYFTNHPARSCIAVRELPKNALCEIEVISMATNKNRLVQED